MYVILKKTVNVERFAGLNIHGFQHYKRLWEYFPDPLGNIVFYTIAKYSQENFHSTLKYCGNHKSLLAQ